MVAQHYDALVVGAGPAGAVAAYELARAGARTLLIEKARLPRYKTCGGGITHKSVRALPPLSLRSPNAHCMPLILAGVPSSHM